MKAKKLPSGSWNVQVFVGYDQNGKKIRKSFTAPTKKEAEYLAASFKAHHQEVTRDSSAMTLSEAIDKYIEFKGATLSPSTIRGYNYIKKKAFPSIMNIKINKLTAHKVQAAVNKEIGTKKPKTIKNEIVLIRTVVKMYAPSVNLSDISLPQPKKYIAQELSLEQVKLLLSEIVKDEQAIPLLIAMCLGLRISEITALRWSDYDTDNMVLSVDKAIVRDITNAMVQKGTKTEESERTIVVPPFLHKLMVRNAQKPSDHIMTKSQSAVREHLRKICDNVGIPHLRVHDLRHINASVMLYLNIPAKYAMERGGWSDIKTMDKIYQFTFKDQKRVVDDRINDFFSQAVDL